MGTRVQRTVDTSQNPETKVDNTRAAERPDVVAPNLEEMVDMMVTVQELDTDHKLDENDDALSERADQRALQPQ